MTDSWGQNTYITCGSKAMNAILCYHHILPTLYDTTHHQLSHFAHMLGAEKAAYLLTP
jgi:hypothetical protein